MKKIEILILLCLTNSTLAAESAKSVVNNHFFDFNGNKEINDIVRKYWSHTVHFYMPEEELYISSSELVEELLVEVRRKIHTKAPVKSEIIEEKECALGPKMKLYSIGFKHYYADESYSEGTTTYILYNRTDRGWKISSLISSDPGKLISCG